MTDTAYDPPIFHDGIWYPTPNTTVKGRLVSVTGVAYEFAPDRAIPHLRLSVPTVVEDIGPVTTHRIIEVHCFPARLLKEVEAVRPREGEDVEISTGAQLVRGFLTYVVCAGGRWSTAEHWAPEDISTYCAFGAHHLHTGEPTQIFKPVAPLAARDAKSAGDALARATDLTKPVDVDHAWPVQVGGKELFTPGDGQ
jgi:hypothetical protein